MNVRKAAATTFWLLFVFIGTAVLLPIIRDALPYEIISVLDSQFHPQYCIESFYLFIVNLASWMMVIAGAIDAILNNRAHFQLLSSFSAIIVLCIPTIAVALIPLEPPYLFWGAYQLIAILGTYWSFRKMTNINRASGQKLIAFIKDIKTGGGTPKNHVSDHYTVFCFALILLVVHAAQIIAFIVYALSYWQPIIDSLI